MGGELEPVWEKRQFGHRARLALTPAQVQLVDAQAHAARAMWNLLHEFWTMTPKCRRSLTAADEAIRPNGTPGQQFVLNASHDLVNSHADKCLDVEGRSLGTNL